VTGIIQYSGAFAEEVAVAAGTLQEVPDSAAPLTATLAEPSRRLSANIPYVTNNQGRNYYCSWSR
jgi:hypothetical protein